METKQIAVILFIIAIILSGISIVLSLGADTDWQPLTPKCDPVVVNCPDSSGGEVSLEILPPPEGEE